MSDKHTPRDGHFDIGASHRKIDDLSVAVDLGGAGSVGALETAVESQINSSINPKINEILRLLRDARILR